MFHRVSLALVGEQEIQGQNKWTRLAVRARSQEAVKGEVEAEP